MLSDHCIALAKNIVESLLGTRLRLGQNSAPSAADGLQVGVKIGKCLHEAACDLAAKPQAA